jgi:hypothetical protein
MIRNELERGWVAGLLEGEGCFSLHRVKQCGGVYVYPKVQLITTDEDVAVKAAAMLEVTYGNGNKPTLPHHKPRFLVNANGEKAIEIMLTVRDLMGIRRKAKIDEILATSFGREENGR